MLVIAIVPAIIAAVGALLYALSTNPKLAEIGRLMVMAGLIALCFALAQHVVHIG